MKSGRRTGVALLCVSLLAMSACNIKTFAKHASKKLGIPVVLKTDDTDVCASKQLHKLYDEYQSLSKEDQKDVRRLLRSYKSIVLNSTVMTGARITGEETFLENTSNGQKKLVSDQRKTDGNSPKVQVEKADSLTITTQGALDESIRTVYSTGSSSIYDMIGQDEATLQKAVSSGQAQLVQQQNFPLIECGDLLSLRDLF